MGPWPWQHAAAAYSGVCSKGHLLRPNLELRCADLLRPELLVRPRNKAAARAEDEEANRGGERARLLLWAGGLRGG